MSRQLQLPVLCLVTDLGVVGGDGDLLADSVAAAVAGGVNIVQIRAPDLTDDAFWKLVDLISSRAGKGALKIVNPSLRVPRRIEGADGVHLSEGTAVTVAEARLLAGEEALVGRSVHSVDRATVAVREGADFLVLGTVFPSLTHPGGETIGLEGIEEVSAAVTVPVIAIGGISQSNAVEVMRSGAGGIAVIRAILGDPEPRTAAERLWDAVRLGYEARR